MLEQEIKTRINSLTTQDWSELLDLYERVIHHKGSFSGTGGGQKLPSGAIQMPYTIEEPIVEEVQEFFVNKHLVVPFDWPQWEEGEAMLRQKSEERFNAISLEDTVKLFTAVIRNDRFCDGAWADLFENGNAAKLLKRLLDFQPSQTS